jgi:putative flippase GtrA
VKALATQAARFGAVGIGATLTHFAVAVMLVEGPGVPVLWANVIAFLTAFLVSYLGNHKWTFARSGGHVRFLPRFAMLAVGGFCANQSILWLIAIRLGMDYRIGLAVALTVVPTLTFLLSKLWVFGHAPRRETAR